MSAKICENDVVSSFVLGVKCPTSSQLPWFLGFCACGMNGRGGGRGVRLRYWANAQIPGHNFKLPWELVCYCGNPLSIGHRICPLDHCKLSQTYCYFSKYVPQLQFNDSSAPITYRLLQFMSTWGPLTRIHNDHHRDSVQ